jgi:hypothetical protein
VRDIIVVGAGGVTSNMFLSIPLVEGALGYSVYRDSDLQWMEAFEKKLRRQRKALNKRKAQRRARTGRRH